MRRRARGKRILRCPNCNSDRIIYEAALITGQVYHCLACDYVGSLIFERDLERPPPEDDE